MATEMLTLIGDDATIEKVEFGTEQIGDGTKTFDDLAGGTGKGKGEWLITAKASTGSIFGSLKVGDLFPADGTEIPAVGDKAKLVTATPFLDATSWSASFSAKEVETTRLINTVNTYRKGKADAEGQVKGIFTLGVTGETGGLLNQFVKVIKKSGTTVTVSEISSAPIYIRGVIRNTNKSGEVLAFLFAQIELYGVNLGAESGNKQEFTSKFRFVSDPVYYERTI
jgi:hypothetical protein